MATEVIVTVPDDAWEDGSYDDDAPARHRLVATLVVNGTRLHLEAHLVVPGADPQRTFAGDEDVAAIHHAVGGDGPWQTTTIDGRAYVLVATPFC
jgi:hypothetical protein